MEQWQVQTAQGPIRRPLVLVEDERLELGEVASAELGHLGVDVVVCTGPHTGETCPLVVDGACSLGRPDLVVCAIDGEWRTSVESAWRAEGVTVAAIDPADRPAWPAHLGAAISQAFAPPEE
jgi:hypothetical protein